MDITMSWDHLHKKYAGLWVALKQDEKTVVASGSSFEAVMKKANKKGYKNPVLTLVPEKLIAFVGYCESKL